MEYYIVVKGLLYVWSDGKRDYVPVEDYKK